MLARKMPPGSALERLRHTWSQRVQSSWRWLLVSAVLLAVLLAAQLARGGTLALRVAAGLLVLGALAAPLLLKRRRAGTDRETLERTLMPAQPPLAERALRALTLLERSEVEADSGSAELARAHFDRVLGQINLDAVRSAASRRAGRYGVLALVLGTLCALILTLGPMRIVEGLGVLVARQGRAPIAVVWLQNARATARLPRYLRSEERQLGMQGQVTLPAGSELIVRGLLRHPGRQLVLTDGHNEVPFVTDAHGEQVARLTLVESGTVAVAARFGAVLVYEPRTLQVVIVVDRPPQVELAGAPRQLQLMEMDSLDLNWRAQDDHGLGQIDLVLRSGNREDRRPLASFDGDVAERVGAYSLAQSDPFLMRAFFPVRVTVEARDTNPDQGAGWGSSDAFTLLPPAIGEPEAERYRALLQARGLFLATLADTLQPPEGLKPQPPAQRVQQLQADVDRVLAEVQSKAPLPAGLSAFVTSQLETLHKAARTGAKFGAALEKATLAIDAAARGVAVREAQKVSIRLGDVAEEVAVGARIARESERRRRGVERVDEGVAVLSAGQPQLSGLGELGLDLGGVLGAGLSRIARVRSGEDMLHTELAALHLAARLRRPTPSFSSSSSSGGGGGGVESGQGSSGPPDRGASHADQQFDHLAEQLEELVQGHEGNLREVERMLQEALQQTASQGVGEEARERAEQLRRAVAGLPEPGQAPSTGAAAAALAREHTAAMAQGLEGGDLQGAIESGHDALDAFADAERRTGSDGWLAERIQRGRAEVQRQLDWAKQQLEQQQRAAREQAADALKQAGAAERELARQAQHLAQGESGEVSLPEQAKGRLQQAQGLMDRAAERLAQGEGDAALKLQREAQRLLEQSMGEPSQQGQQPQPQAGRDTSGSRGGMALGGDVPSDRARQQAEEFRRRVIEGLGKGRAGPLAPAVKRYAEGLLQ